LKIFVAGFDRVLRTRSRLALSGGLKRPQSKSFDRLRTLSETEGLKGADYSWSQPGFMNNPG
jgi:hypothetical protein